MNDDIKRYKDILKDLNTEEERLMKIFFCKYGKPRNKQ